MLLDFVLGLLRFAANASGTSASYENGDVYEPPPIQGQGSRAEEEKIEVKVRKKGSGWLNARWPVGLTIRVRGRACRVYVPIRTLDERERLARTCGQVHRLLQEYRQLVKEQL